MEEYDDFIFEPTAWDLAFSIGIGVDPQSDRIALDELADAMLVTMPDGPLLERLTNDAIAALWTSELEAQIRDGLSELRERDEWGAGATVALTEFERGPRDAEVSREVVRHLALELGQQDAPVFFCLHCLDEAAAAATTDDRRRIAAEVAIVARRDAAVSPEELARHVGALGRGGELGTRERREAVRRRLGRLARFATASLPVLASELTRLASEPVPPNPEDDDVWGVVCGALLAEVAAPELN